MKTAHEKSGYSKFEQPLFRSSPARLPFPSGKTQGLQKKRFFQSNLFIVENRL
jgi:hypothetical protein